MLIIPLHREIVAELNKPNSPPSEGWPRSGRGGVFSSFPRSERGNAERILNIKYAFPRSRLLQNLKLYFVIQKRLNHFSVYRTWFLPPQFREEARSKARRWGQKEPHPPHMLSVFFPYSKAAEEETALVPCCILSCTTAFNLQFFP